MQCQEQNGVREENLSMKVRSITNACDRGPCEQALNANGKWRKLTFPMDFLQTVYKVTVLASVTLVTTVGSEGCQEKVVERHETKPLDAQAWFQKGEAAMQAGDLAA